MNKKIFFILLMILLCPISIFARSNPYSSVCQTLPANAPVSITLRNIGYKDSKTYIGDKFYNKNQIITEPARINICHAIRNKSNKTITSCYYKVKIFYSPIVLFSETLYEDNYMVMNCSIRSGKAYAETSIKDYDESKEYHRNLKSGLYLAISKVVYKVYFVKYSDGTSETFNPDI